MAEDTKTQDAPEAPPQIPGIPVPQLDLGWMKVPTERPPKPQFGGPEGFTLKMADAGMYGYAPDHWPYENDLPRGAYPSKDMGLPAPYTIYEKADLWADNCADLYELAIKDQWKPATEISWGSIEPLAEHVEAALDQVYSNISEQSYNSLQVLGGWFKQMSYGYHEVKLYLATQMYDQARHTEAFRKRALSNGGGLGVQTPGFFNRTVYAAFKWSEYVTYVNIMRSSWLLALCEQGEKYARSQADRQLFEGTANDLRRHLAYGIAHIKHYVQMDPRKRRHVMTWLDRGETMFAADLQRDKAYREANILALGDTIVQGKERLKEVREAQLKKYMLTLEAATIQRGTDRMAPTFVGACQNP